MSVSGVNRVLGTPRVPFLDLLQAAFDTASDQNSSFRIEGQQPAMKLLRHSRQAVSVITASVGMRLRASELVEATLRV